MLASLLSGEFLLHIACWLHFYLGSFSYTAGAGFTFLWGVSLKHSVLASFFNLGCLAYTPSWLHFCLGSFSYTSRAGFIFIWGVSLKHPVLASFFFMWGVSLTHTMLTLFLCGEFVLHMPCWLHFYLGSLC